MAQGLVPGVVLVGLEGLIRELGGDPVAIAERSGLSLAAFSDPDLPVVLGAAVEAFELAAIECDCPDFGLRLAQRQNLSVLGPLFVLMSLASTIGEALELMCQHLGTLHSGGLIAHAKSVPEGLTIEYGTAVREAGRDRQVMEHGLALSANFVRSYRSDWQPVYVQFRHAAPASLRWHHALFGTNIYFNQEHTAICIDRAAAATPIRAPSAGTRKLTSRMLRQQKGFDAHGAVSRTQAMVRALLPYSSDCSIGSVAKFLGMSTRSLQRYLAEAGVTFESIRDATRADLAKKYLLQSTMSVAEIADVLGYSQPSAFARSFRRWYQMPPLRFRNTGMATSAAS